MQTQGTKRMDNMRGFCAYVEPRHSKALILSPCKGCEGERDQQRRDDSENSPKRYFPGSIPYNSACCCRQRKVARKYQELRNQSDLIKRNFCKDHCTFEEQKIK